jgi:hypothetical protein
MYHTHKHNMVSVDRAADALLRGDKKGAADFYDAIADFVDSDRHYRIFALLLNCQRTEAADELREWLQVADDNHRQALNDMAAERDADAKRFEASREG